MLDVLGYSKIRPSVNIREWAGRRKRKCRTVSGGAEGANRPTLLLPAAFRRETASDMADEMRLTWERLRAPCSAKL